MHTIRNRRAASPPSRAGEARVTPQATTAKAAKKDAPFLLRDAGTPPTPGAPPAFPLDIIIAANPLLNRGSPAAMIMLPPPLPLPRKAKRREAVAKVAIAPPATHAAPKRRTRNGAAKPASAQRAAAGPVTAIEPIRPITPARPAPTPLRPQRPGQQPGQQPGRASPQRPRRDGNYAQAPDGSRIAALDLRPASAGRRKASAVSALAPAVEAQDIQQSSASKRSHSVPMDGAAALSLTTPAAAAPKYSTLPEYQPLPRAAAVTAWRRNGFIDAIGYWVRGAKRRMLAWLATPPRAPAQPIVRRAKAPSSPSRAHGPDAEIRALRAENEHLRQQIALLLARGRTAR